ncbi:DUF4124 domain-containing protein [Rhodocyclaceae bacterium SMB388]
MFVLLTLSLGTPAHATVFKCVGSDGSVTYTNDRSIARNCTALNPDLPVSTIPPPPRSSGGQAPGAPGSSSRPADFPRVSPGAQRTRDDTRRQVLERELEAEQSALETARNALVLQQQVPSETEAIRRYRDQIELHERNIEALEREMRALR